MSRHHRLRRFAAVATCVGSAAATAALGAAPAMAVTKVPCVAKVFASGSSLQKAAQNEVWLEPKGGAQGAIGWGGTDWQASASKTTECTVTPESASGTKITYNSTSSGQGLEEFGANSGVFKPDNDTNAKTAGEKKEILDVANAEPVEESGKIEAAGLDYYVGSDDAPSIRQNGEAQAAAKAKNPSLITIPVAQAPVAVMLSLPEGCEIAAGSELDLTNALLSELYDAKIPATTNYAANTWGAFLEADSYTKVAAPPGAGQFSDNGPQTESVYREVETSPGVYATKLVSVTEGGCVQAIRLQARYTESGTSYAFKTYLSQIKYSVWGPYADDAQNWPAPVSLEIPLTSEDPSNATIRTQKSEKGSQLAEDTAVTPGSAGYANSADAVKSGHFTEKATNSIQGVGTLQFECENVGKVESGSEYYGTQAECESKTGAGSGEWKRIEKPTAKSTPHQILWAEIQNNGAKAKAEATYADPLNGKTVANCEATKLVPGDEAFPYSYNDSWAGITTTDPNIAGDVNINDYSLCALTFDLTWHHFQNTGLYGKSTQVEEVADTIHNLFEYITTVGQENIQSNYYQRVPTAMAAHIGIAVDEIKY
jgi:hypothetical protein